MKQKRSSPESLDAILAQYKQVTGVGRLLDLSRIGQFWERLAGPYLASHGVPSGIREDNTLIIQVESSAWMQRFSYKKWDLIRRINRMAGYELVSDIFVQLEDE